MTARMAVALAFAAGLLAQTPDFAKPAGTGRSRPQCEPSKAGGPLRCAGVYSRGPAAGQPFPTFEARDQSGQVRTLASLMGPKGLVLVFFRSADW
jgi:hypothetical protein